MEMERHCSLSDLKHSEVAVIPSEWCESERGVEKYHRSVLNFFGKVTVPYFSSSLCSRVHSQKVWQRCDRCGDHKGRS